MTMTTPSLRYLFALVVSVNHLHIAVVGEKAFREVGGSQLYLPIVADQYDECIDVMCYNEASLDACEKVAYEMAGNLFTFSTTLNECCIKSCGRELFLNSSIYQTSAIAPQIGYSVHLFNRGGGAKIRAKRDSNWETPAKAGLSLIPVFIALSTAPGGAAAAVVVAGISLMIDFLDKKEDTYEQIRQRVLHDMRSEIADDKVHTMERQLENWEDGTFFRHARILNIRAISYQQLHKELINGNLQNQVPNDNIIREYDDLIDQMVNLHSDVDFRQNIFKLRYNHLSSLAYYHEYAGLDIYILSMLIIAKKDQSSTQMAYREQLTDSAEEHYNYLMFLFGKRLIYGGSITGKKSIR